MKAFRYKITSTNIPRCSGNYHDGVPVGYAYETATHYIHFFGSADNFYMIHPGLTVLHSKDDIDAPPTLLEWIGKYFQGQDIQQMDFEIGESFDGVWRPGLYYYKVSEQALNTNETERHFNEQSLRVLLEKLDDILLYIEPDAISFNTYGHKTRELLILACTEVENFWISYLQKKYPGTAQRFTTNDYVKLANPLFLQEYQCSLKSVSAIPPFNPFLGWDISSPTTSLAWYDAYNKTKHNKASHFKDGTFLYALNAVVASLILYMVKFSPFPMLEEKGTFNSQVNQHFRFSLSSPNLNKVYLPKLAIPASYRKDIFIYDSHEQGNWQPFQVNAINI